MTAANSVSVVFSISAEKPKNNWSNKGNGPQHWIPKITTEDKYFPRKVTVSSNCPSKVFSTIFNSSFWIVLPLSFYSHFWTIFIFLFLLQLNLQGCSSVRCVAGCFLTLLFEEAIKPLPTCMFSVIFTVCCLRSFSVYVPTSLPLLFMVLILYLVHVSLFSSCCFSK